MEDSTELLLQRYRSDIHSMCAAFPEPATAYKIKMEFLDNFDDEVPFRRFGYPSLESFLNDHPNLIMVSYDGKLCYKAKITEATQDIQSLIAKQKKKKKRGANKKGRGGPGLQRGTYNRSLNAKNLQNFNPLSGRGNRGGKSFSFSNRTPNIYSMPDHIRNGVNHLNSSHWAFGAAKATSNAKDVRTTHGKPPTYTAPTIKSYSPLARVPAPVPLIPALGYPATGVSQILRALDRCGGQATITKLNREYKTLFGTQFDAAEMTRHFGTNNMRKIHTNYLSDKVELNAGYGGMWNFVSKEIALKQKEWDSHHRSTIVETPRYRWDKPSVKELYDKSVEMLVNMYPGTIPIDQMAEYYKRLHGVQVNPVELYCKNWDDLVLTTFKDKLRLTSDRHVVLTPAAIASRKLTSVQPKVQKETKLKRVTAADLGLEYSDEEEEEYDDDDSSLVSVPSLPSEDDLNDLFAPSVNVLPTHNAVSTTSNNKSFNSTFSGNATTCGGNASHPTDPFNTRPAAAPPRRGRSIFHRITAPGREVPEVRKDNQHVVTSVFGHTRSATSPEIELPVGQPKRPSVFSRQPLPPRPKSPEDECTDILTKELDRLELVRRDRHMDSLLETERAKENAKKPSSLPLQVFGFGESAGSSGACANPAIKEPVFAFRSSPQKNVERGIGPIDGFFNKPAEPDVFANAARSAQAILNRKNKQHKETDNLSSYSLKNQLPAFGQRLEPESPELTISPGKFNVKFNGRSEQFSNLVRSRRND